MYWLNRAQQERERKADEVQRKREDAAEEAREQRELEFANQTTQNAALQSYIDQMTQLLIYGNAPQLPSESRIRETIHARTLHVLDQLDETPRGRLRKRALLRFLCKTELIPGRLSQNPPYDTNILFEANLRHADLESLRLEGADLRGADLRGANLRSANLSGAILVGAKPEENVVLADADLNLANLKGARIAEEQLTRCKSLEGATMPNDQQYEEWLKNK